MELKKYAFKPAFILFSLACITSFAIFGKAETVSISNIPDQYTVNNGILFYSGDFGQVNRGTLFPGQTIRVASAADAGNVLVRKVTLSASLHTVSCTAESSRLGSVYSAAAGPLRLETSIFKKRLPPLGPALDYLRDADSRLENLKKNISGDVRQSPEKKKEFESLLLKRNSALSYIESGFSDIHISLDLSSFPEMKKEGGKIDVTLGIEFEKEDGHREESSFTFSVGRISRPRYRPE